MATTNYLSKFKLDDTTIEIKDATARSDATSALNTATTAANKIAELEALTKVSSTYDSKSETMTIVNGTHSVA